MPLKRTLRAALVVTALAITPLYSAFNDAQAQQAVSQGTLETVVGLLAETAPQLKLETIQSACQLTNERRIDFDLRSPWFYSSDTALYQVENGEVFLYFGNGIVNPVLNNVKEASKELASKGIYFPNQEDVDTVAESAKAGDTLKVKLSDLRLKWAWDEWSYLEIETDNYGELKKAERLLAERVFCQGADFVDNMKMLNNAGITTTRIYVLKPRYVKEKATGKAIALASWLYGFGNYSGFGAPVRYAYSHNGLRGVKVAVKSSAQKIDPIIDPIEQAYQTILKYPDKSVKAMTPDIATGLSGLVTGYLANQKR